MNSSGLSHGEKSLQQKLRVEIVQTAEAEGLKLSNNDIDERVDRAMNRREVRSLHKLYSAPVLMEPGFHDRARPHRCRMGGCLGHGLGQCRRGEVQRYSDRAVSEGRCLGYRQAGQAEGKARNPIHHRNTTHK